jgi:hypothetical protein
MLKRQYPTKKHKHVWIRHVEGTAQACQRCGIVRNGTKVYPKGRERFRRLRA